MSDAEELKMAHYKTHTVLMSEHGTIDYDPDRMKDIVGGENLSYDEYLDIQIATGNKVRACFQQCFYEIPLGFKGQIEKKNSKRICFKRIYVDGMYSGGEEVFEGKEDHVWMDIRGFEKFSVGDCLEFYAEVYRYVKTGKGKAIDFGLRNPVEIKKIGSYELPSDRQLKRQAVSSIVCETCNLREQCFGGSCLLPKGEMDAKINMLMKMIEQ